MDPEMLRVLIETGMFEQIHSENAAKSGDYAWTIPAFYFSMVGMVIIPVLFCAYKSLKGE